MVNIKDLEKFGLVGGDSNTKIKEIRQYLWAQQAKDKLKSIPTWAEKKMSYYLNKHNIPFEKQYLIITNDNKIYFADFFIRGRNIVIEVDGGYHKTKEQISKDAERDADLLEMGIKTIRISNDDVYYSNYKEINKALNIKKK